MNEERNCHGEEGNCQNGRSCDNKGTSCDASPLTSHRREVLGLVAAGGSFALAGCLGVFGEPSPREAPIVGIEDRFDITFENEEDTIEVAGNENLLEAGEAQGWDLPYFCRTGFCGQCLARVDGDGHELVHMTINQYEPLDDHAIEDGYVLTCTGYPRSDFSLQTGQVGALVVDDDDDDDDDEVDDTIEATHTIDYVNERWTIEVPEDQSLLVAGEERGFELPYRCREGWCGQCLAQVDGDTRELVHLEVNDYEYLDDAALQDGYTLTCQGFPRDDFSLESGKFEEEDWPDGSPP